MKWYKGHSIHDNLRAFLCLLLSAKLIHSIISTTNMLLHRLTTRITRSKRIRRRQITLMETRNTTPISIRSVNNTMRRTTILPICPLLNQITHIDNIDV